MLSCCFPESTSGSLTSSGSNSLYVPRGQPQSVSPTAHGSEPGRPLFCRRNGIPNDSGKFGEHQPRWHLDLYRGAAGIAATLMVRMVSPVKTGWVGAISVRFGNRHVVGVSFKKPCPADFFSAATIRNEVDEFVGTEDPTPDCDVDVMWLRAPRDRRTSEKRGGSQLADWHGPRPSFFDRPLALRSRQLSP